MSTQWWFKLDDFVADAKRADDAGLLDMRRWAHEHETSADRRGMGRNPKARRHFRQMTKAADEELLRRGLLN